MFESPGISNRHIIIHLTGNLGTKFHWYPLSKIIGKIDTLLKVYLVSWMRQSFLGQNFTYCERLERIFCLKRQAIVAESAEPHAKSALTKTPDVGL